MSIRATEFFCLDIAPSHMHVCIQSFRCMYNTCRYVLLNSPASISRLFICTYTYMHFCLCVCMHTYLYLLPTSSVRFLSCLVAVALFILTYVCIYLRKYVCMHAYLNTLPTSFASTYLLSRNCLACAC